MINWITFRSMETRCSTSGTIRTSESYLMSKIKLSLKSGFRRVKFKVNKKRSGTALRGFATMSTIVVVEVIL